MLNKLTFLLVFFTTLSLYAQPYIKPIKLYKADGSVTDIVYVKNRLYVATSASSVNVFDKKTAKKVQTITIAKIKNFMGKTINSKIYSVDVLHNNILILSQANHGFRQIDIFANNTLTPALPSSKKLYIAKAKFLDDENILYALLSNDIVSYNFKTQTINWSLQASQSKFSDFALNEDKTKVALVDESGDVHIFDTKNGKLLKTLSGENLDNVFDVAFKNNIIATAGQDRRVVVYDLKHNTAYYKKSNFIIYSAGVSPSGEIIAYASDENNNVTLFKRVSKLPLGTYTDIKMTPVQILFIDEKNFFVASDDNTVNLYKVK